MKEIRKSTLKKFLIFRKIKQKQKPTYFSGNGTFWLTIKNFLFSQKKVFLIFRGMELCSPKLKKVVIFQKGTFQAYKIKKSFLKRFLIYWGKKPSSFRLKELIFFLNKKFIAFSGGNLENLKNKKIFTFR